MKLSLFFSKIVLQSSLKLLLSNWIINIFGLIIEFTQNINGLDFVFYLLVFHIRENFFPF